MSKVSKKRRGFEISKRRERRRKLKKLKESYLKAKDKAAKERLFVQMRKIAPHLVPEVYLGLKPSS